jgi:membrane protein implicated in regulation of membrane protease activity
VNPRLQKLASDWKTYVALVAAAATAMSAFTDLVSKAADTVAGLKSLSPEARWLVAAVFLVLTIVFLLAALSRRSVLLEPKRFLLSSENPEHLVGREEEVAHLARQCSRHSMVFLTGDSGTGKSAL